MKPLNSFEILDKTGLTIGNYHMLMSLSGILCGFLFLLVIFLVIANIK